jgi:pyrroline-5-carboxylate reductase
MRVSDINPSALTELASLGIHVTRDNAAVASQSQVLFLCTKPDAIVPALKEVAGQLQRNAIIISIAAGLQLAALESAAPSGTKCIRVMPNTPALVGYSASAYTLGSSCTEADGKIVHALLSSFGTCVRVAEKDLNGVTGLSGSGPAYVFLFIEALADGGVRSGLSRAVAQQLAIQTVLGSAKLMEVTGKHPGQLKDQVAR